MASNDSSDPGGVPVLFNGILLFITVIGGLFLASERLSSNRPISLVDNPKPGIGEQVVDARLWEDPFEPSPPAGLRETTPEDLSNLLRDPANEHKLLILPVMLPGGGHSEDHESRIRSRFAIVSALGTSGYVPADAEHVGLLRIPWPSTDELSKWKKEPAASWPPSFRPPPMADKAWSLRGELISGEGNQRWRTTNLVLTDRQPEVPPSTPSNTASRTLELRFERYLPRSFQPGGAQSRLYKQVMVLWMDDSYFEDDPLLRLALFAHPLLEALKSTKTPEEPKLCFHLIGPRRSSTLRQMLPAYPGRDNDKWVPKVTNEVAGVLKHMALFSATANAMDEVLVTNASLVPREALRRALVRGTNGPGMFESARFFNTTDAQLAAEIYSELELRQVKLTNEKEHLMLLSEWDTFYGRMLALTYAAELAVHQKKVSDRAQFVSEYVAGSRQFPGNFHSLVYLRGMDGEASTRPAGDRDAGVAKGATRPVAMEELLSWKPDANKAEGPAQFDYLSRAGESIRNLRHHLRASNRGDLKAIGIVGSDAYDVMLIMQALRFRFPDIHFFTTDLDARFWHPNELKWTRNLIVASSYGLQLYPDLQRGISPFRDSSQTAQYAATLAALGDTNLLELTNIPPRLFEVGNRTVVDLSRTAGMTNTPPAAGTNRATLHPLTQSASHLESHGAHERTVARWTLTAVGLVLALTLYFWWNPLRPRTHADTGFLSRPLVYSEADVGGPEGFNAIWSRIEAESNAGDLLCKSLVEKLQDRLAAIDAAFPLLPPLPGSSQSTGAETANQVTRQRTIAERNQELKVEAFVGLLNQLVHHEEKIPTPAFYGSRNASEDAWKKAEAWEDPAPWWLAYRRLRQRECARKLWDDFLDRISSLGTPKATGEEALEIARDCRNVADKRYRLCWHYAWCAALFLGTCIGLGFWVGSSIWNDTFHTDLGEPFSLTNGVSAWPNILFRLLAAIVASAFIVVLLGQLKAMYFFISRRYRIPLSATPRSRAWGRVCASELWQRLDRTGSIPLRLVRAGIPTALYFAAGWLLLIVSGMPFEPVRGETVANWAEWATRSAVLLFLLLSFLTVDSALRTRTFILELSAVPTEYPQSTRDHFCRLRGDVHPDHIDEWIDVQLIADLTERIYGLLWFPSIAFLALLAGRNQWTDNWPTSPVLLLILAFNFALALASIVILQSAALRAKHAAEQNLDAKLKRARAAVAASTQSNDSDQIERLLEEIRCLRRGAFVRLRENPILGALLLPSVGMILIQLLAWFGSR